MFRRVERAMDERRDDSDESRAAEGVRIARIDDEIDDSLIRWMRDLSPAQRLQFLEEQVAFVTRFLGAAKR